MGLPSRYMTSDLIEWLIREIAENRGNELFAVLSEPDSERVFTRAVVVCRGNEDSVPALMSRVQPGNMTLHNHPSGLLRPSPQDMHIATLFGEEGSGSMIVNNQVSDCHVIVEPHFDQEIVPVRSEDIDQVFQPGGRLSELFEHYEVRDSQRHMAHAVADAINHGKVLTVEAGTGTGKSLAYTIPALFRNKSNPRERIAIATKTIALQEQLVHKDIPLAQKLMDNPPEAALVKGRNNYVCLRKLFDQRDVQLQLFTEDEEGVKREIEGLVEWFERTENGDKADLPFVPSHEAWDAVRSDADMCLGAKCPYFQQSPFYQSRRQAAKAGILVVNQALLFADLSLRQASGNYKSAAVIPHYDHIVLDEAHSIEDVATDYFGQKANSFGFRITIGKLLSSPRADKGLLMRLYNMARTEKEIEPFFKALQDDILPMFKELQDKLLEQLENIARALHDSLNPDQNKTCIVWLKRDLLANGSLEPAQDEIRLFNGYLQEIIKVLGDLATMWNNAPESFLDKTEGMQIELTARIDRCKDFKDILEQFPRPRKDDQVPWLALRIFRGNHYHFEYNISPLDISPTLREALFQPFKSVTLSSATLDLHDQFQFFMSRCGLADLEEKPKPVLKFLSPFNYAQQARLFLLRFPSEANHSGFASDIANLILEVHPQVQGGTLVLFTSYNLLNRVAQLVERPLAERAVELLVQGKEPRSTLAERLKRSYGVLLGTDSFWEGVDLPGDALTKLIVTKLPFHQMGDPIFEARCRAIEQAGFSSFKELSLPLALLKFKQGVGRLIRTSQDQGLMLVCDNRIRTKRYGRDFMNLVQQIPAWELSPGQIGMMLQSEPPH